MIVILYDSECQLTNGLAIKIKNSIEREHVDTILMTLDRIDDQYLNSAKGIVFGCRSGFSTGVSEAMLRFMNTTYDRYEHQTWKNKFAAGFSPDTGLNSTKTIEDLCNFAAKHSMIWISQGHLAENEGRNVFYGSSRTRVNKNKSFLGCIATAEPMDLTADCFGMRIAAQVRRLL
jgi:hypothetical protein